MMHKVTKILGAAMLTMALIPAANANQQAASSTLIASENCFAIGQSVAAERGVTLVAAESAVQNGQKVCKIVVLTPATNGGRPKREVFFVPQ